MGLRPVALRADGAPLSRTKCYRQQKRQPQLNAKFLHVDNSAVCLFGKGNRIVVENLFCRKRFMWPTNMVTAFSVANYFFFVISLRSERNFPKLSLTELLTTNTPMSEMLKPAELVLDNTLLSLTRSVRQLNISTVPIVCRGPYSPTHHTLLGQINYVDTT